jgi:hypothetical protein
LAGQGRKDEKNMNKNFKTSLNETLQQICGLSLAEIVEAAPGFFQGGEDASGNSPSFRSTKPSDHGLNLAGVSPTNAWDTANRLATKLGFLSVAKSMISLSNAQEALEHARQINKMRAALWQFTITAEDWVFDQGCANGPDGATVEPVAVCLAEPGDTTKRIGYRYLANRETDPKLRGDIGDAVATAIASRDQMLQVEMVPEPPPTPRFM